MNAKQELIAFIGVFLIALTIWQHWRSEVKAVLFNSTPKSIPRTDVGTPLVDQYGNPNSAGGFTLQPGTVPGSTNIVPLIP